MCGPPNVDFPYVLETGFWPTLYILSLGRIIPEYSWFFIRIRFCGTLSKWSSSLHTLWGQDDPNDLYHPLALDDPKPTRWDANLSKLLLMPMSMDGDIVCFTGYLDLRIFVCPQTRAKVSSKNMGQQNWIFFCLWLNQGRCPGGRTSVSYDYFIKSKK